jgi:hypothetical protein
MLQVRKAELFQVNSNPFLNSMMSLCVYKDSIFSTSYSIGKFILQFLWSETSLEPRKSVVSHAVPAGSLQVTDAQKFIILRTIYC